MTEYLVIYETAEDDGWGAYSPDLPGCYATGKSQSEVEQLMREAIPIHIEAMREAGEVLPESHRLIGLVAA
jgi:predicted RNase H-like HicB family nuclease